MCENVPNWDAQLMTIDTKVFAKIDSPYYDTFPGIITGFDPTNSEYVIKFDDFELGTRHVPDYNVLNESEEKTDSEEEKPDLNFFSEDEEEDEEKTDENFLNENEENPDSNIFSEDEEKPDINKLNGEEKRTDKEVEEEEEEDEDKKPNLDLLNEDEDEEKPVFKTSNEEEENPLLSESTDNKNKDDEVYAANNCTKSFLTALARLEQMTRMKTTKIENLSKLNDAYEQLENHDERETYQRRTVSLLFTIHRLNADLVQPLGIMHNFLKENAEKDNGIERCPENPLLIEESICATELAFERGVRTVHIDSSFNNSLIKVFHTILVLASHINPDNHMIIYSAIETLVLEFSENLSTKMADQLQKMTYSYMHPLGEYSLFGAVQKPEETVKEEKMEEDEHEEFIEAPLITEYNSTNIINNDNENIAYDLIPFDNDDQIIYPIISEEESGNQNFMYTTIPYNEQDQVLFPVMPDDEMTNMDGTNDEKVVYSLMPYTDEHHHYSIYSDDLAEYSSTSILETTVERSANMFTEIPYEVDNHNAEDEDNDVKFMVPMITDGDDQEFMDINVDDPDYVFQYSVTLPEEDAIEYALQQQQY